MRVYLEALDLWETVEDYEVPKLPVNHTMTQLKNHKERKTRKAKTKVFFFSGCKNNIYKNYEFEVCERHLGVSQIRILK